jgi:hypothetical protein
MPLSPPISHEPASIGSPAMRVDPMSSFQTLGWWKYRPGVQLQLHHTLRKRRVTWAPRLEVPNSLFTLVEDQDRLAFEMSQ